MPPVPHRFVPTRTVGQFPWYQTAFAETTIQLWRYLRALYKLDELARQPIPVETDPQ